MFGRLLKISIFDDYGNSVVLVDTNKRKYNDYLCRGTIERFTGSQMDCLTLSIYNLDPVLRGEISVRTYNNIRVDFGYEDDGGIMTTIFEGKIIRPQHKRQEVVTDETVIYAYDSGNFKTHGFFSKTYFDGANYYDIAEDILNRGNVKISYELSEKLKEYTVKGSKSLYGTQDELLQNISKETGLTYKTENNVARVFGNSEDLEEVVVFSKKTQNGEILSESGLIGIPTLATDGIYLKCLINPKIKIFSKIKISNSIISSNQDGKFPEVEAGGQFSSSGIYKIVKITVEFSNDGAQNYMDLKAISTDIYEGVNNG